MTDNYRNSNSLLKQNVRDILSKELLSSRKTIRVLSLPADNFYFERHLEQLYPNKKFEFYCLEMNRKVWLRGKKRLKNNSLRNKLYYINTSTTNFLQSFNKRKKFDLIWLDYCGEYTDHINYDITLTRNFLTKNTVVGVTLLGKREKKQYTDKLKKMSGKRSLSVIRKEVIPKLLANNLNLSVNKIINYCDKIQNAFSAPMFLYIFNNIKTESYPFIKLNATLKKIAA